MTDLTSANAVITLVVPRVFNTPQQLFRFAADDIYDVPAIEAGEKSMGVDGYLSAGFVFKEIEQAYSLQADSPSNSIFDKWFQFEQTNRTKLAANGTTVLPSIGLKFVMTRGYLMSYAPVPAAGRILKPRKYGVAWNLVSPQPA